MIMLIINEFRKHVMAKIAFGSECIGTVNFVGKWDNTGDVSTLFVYCVGTLSVWSRLPVPKFQQIK